MKTKLWAIKDTLTETYGEVFTFQNLAKISQEIEYYLTSPEANKFNKYAKSLEIWELGTYDLKTGKIKYKPEFAISVNSIRLSVIENWNREKARKEKINNGKQSTN